MKFFSIACECPHKDHTSQPMIAYDEEGEYIPVYRTKELAQIELSSMQEEIEHGHKLVIREFEVKPL